MLTALVAVTILPGGRGKAFDPDAHHVEELAARSS